jgi:outer membrane protein OmpA-like peptidoglycan-associated protein
MTIQLQRVLWLWAGILVLALLLIFPLATWIRVVVMLGVVSVTAVGWVVAYRRVARLRESVKLAANVSVPPASFRRPVVLVCGDGLGGLFGSIPELELAVRVTHQGCYLRVPALDQLPSVTESILALRPGWGAQLSVMFIINPAAHSDEAELAGRIRTLGHQASLAGQGASMPLTMVSYFHAPQGEAPWFCWKDGQSNPRVLDAGACVDLADWLQQPADSLSRAMRIQSGVQLNNAAQWFQEVVLPHFNVRAGGADRGLAVCWAVRPVPALTEAVEGNLWEQWLRDKVALVDPRRAVTKAVLPFPDPVLSLIPLRAQRTPGQHAGIVAMWMFGLAGVVALVSSAWQNTLLVRQVTDDLRRYAPLLAVESQLQRTSHLRQKAEAVLGEAAHRLDIYHRHGEPLSLGLGLYRGAPLREPLLAALSHRRMLSGPMALPASEPVRLDSLSLFSPGSARLKTGSTKVLVNALVGIKAQPGWLIVIAGHTDATGDAARNLRLSRERAAAVHEWMLQVGGVPDSCFAVQGFGASQPIAGNDTEAGRAANRRVDIRLVPEVGACAFPTTGSDSQPPVASRDDL